MMFRTTNPAMRRMRNATGTADAADRATYKGVAAKTIYFAVLTLAMAAAIMIYMYIAFSQIFADAAIGVAPNGALVDSFLRNLFIILIVSLILTLVGALGCMFAPRAIPVFGTIYAAAQGALIGVSSGFAELAVPGVVMAALASTFVVFLVMSVLFFTGVIKVGQRFRSVMMSILFSVIILSLIFTLLAIFVPSINSMVQNNALFAVISVIISVIMVIIASLFILFDLSIIKETVDGGLPKHYEWFGAFGLTVTLIWLYMEFLRLFLKLAALFGRRR